MVSELGTISCGGEFALSRRFRSSDQSHLRKNPLMFHFMIRDGIPVIAARLAERLHVTPPTVTATLQRMERDGLVTHARQREIQLTENGSRTAEDLVRQQRVSRRGRRGTPSRWRGSRGRS